MRFRLSKEIKRYFNKIMAEGGYLGSDKNKFMQFDIYYNCALIGFSALKISEDASDLEDMMSTYPKEFKNSKPYIAGLLIATEFKRQGFDVTSRDLEKLMLKYLDNEKETYLSNDGYDLLNAYSLAGAQIYRENSADAPRTKEDFLLTVNRIIKQYYEDKNNL